MIKEIKKGREKNRINYYILIALIVLFIIGSVVYFLPKEILPSPADNIILEYNFDEGAGATAYDSSGFGNNGTIINTTWTNGEKGNSLEFNGTNSYIETGQDLSWDASQNFSIGFWMKSNSNTTIQGIMGKPGRNSWEWSFIRINESLSFSYWNTGGSQAIQISAGGMKKDVWYRVFLVYNGTSKKAELYVNGSLIKSQAPITGTFQNRNNNVTIGYTYSSAFTPFDYYFNGSIDEIKIYNKSLSLSEIEQDYNSYISICRNNIIESGEVCDNLNLNGKACSDFGFTGAGLSCLGDCSNYNLSGCYNTLGDLVLNLSFNEGAGSTAYDSSGYGNNGTLTGGNRVPGIKGQGIKFNGIYTGALTENIKIPLSQSLNFTDNHAFSASIWINPLPKPKAIGLAQDFYLFSQGNVENASNYQGYAIYLEWDWNKTVITTKSNMPFSSSGQGLVVDINKLNYSTWENYLMVFNGSVLSLYRDGKFIGTDTDANVNISSSYKDMYIGALIGTYKPVNGTIDEFKIWNRALTNSEVLAEYNSFFDTILPYFTKIPDATTITYGEGFGVDFDAADETGFDSYSINWTSNFIINQSGWLKNITILSEGLYLINVTINDSSGNKNSTIYSVNVSKVLQTCGNNIIEGEVCDNLNLNGKACSDFGFIGAGLSCLGDCSGFNTSLCISPSPFCGDGICQQLSASPPERLWIKIINFFRSLFGLPLASPPYLEDCSICPGDCGACPVKILDLGFNEGQGNIAVDASGSNNGVLYDINWTRGIIGNSLEFNGINSYVNVSNSTSLGFNKSQGTIMMWIKYPGYSGVEPENLFEDSMGNIELALSRFYPSGGFTGGQLFFYPFENPTTGWGNYVMAKYKLPENIWVHVAVTWDYSKKNATIYINGSAAELSFNGLADYWIEANTGDWLFGRKSTGRYFNGSIDEIKIYNKALSLSEVKQIYNNEKPKFIIYYKFDEGIGNITYDSSGNENDGNLNNTTWTSGIKNSGLSFNGTSYVNVSKQVSIANAITMSAWVNPFNDSAQFIISYSLCTSDGFSLKNNGVAGNINGDFNLNINPLLINTWSYLTASYNGSAVKIYVNGIEANSTERTGSIFNANKLIVGVGQLQGECVNGGEGFNGTIDEVKIWDKALTEEEIKNEYLGITCGNGIKEGIEECDGTNFAGKTCSNFGYNSGGLSCNSSCSLIRSGCYNSGNPNPGGGGGGGGGGGTCTETCASKNFSCGNQTICGTSRNCGSCSAGKICSAGKCAAKTETKKNVNITGENINQTDISSQETPEKMNSTILWLINLGIIIPLIGIIIVIILRIIRKKEAKKEQIFLNHNKLNK